MVKRPLLQYSLLKIKELTNEADSEIMKTITHELHLRKSLGARKYLNELKTKLNKEEKYINKNNVSKCKFCRRKVLVKGFLYDCNNSGCNVKYWSKNLWSATKDGKKFYEFKYDENKNKNKKKLTEDFKKILKDAGVKSSKPGQNFVYQIKLKKADQLVRLKKIINKDANNKNKLFYEFYIGKTNRNPLERYLRHLIGYQSGKKIVNRYGVGLVNFEGPMTSKEANEREETLADELRLTGINVYQN